MKVVATLSARSVAVIIVVLSCTEPGRNGLPFFPGFRLPGTQYIKQQFKIKLYVEADFQQVKTFGDLPPLLIGLGEKVFRFSLYIPVF